MRESFSFVAVEESQRDGIVIEELEVDKDGIANEELEVTMDSCVKETGKKIAIDELGSHKDIAAGYASF